MEGLHVIHKDLFRRAFVDDGKHGPVEHLDGGSFSSTRSSSLGMPSALSKAKPKERDAFWSFRFPDVATVRPQFGGGNSFHQLRGLLVRLGRPPQRIKRFYGFSGLF